MGKSKIIEASNALLSGDKSAGKMKNIKYWLFGVVVFLILLMLSANIFYYAQRHNELAAIEDLLSGKQIKCGNTIYQLDNEHFLIMLYDEIGRNKKAMAIMKRQSDNSADGARLYRCSSINESSSKDIIVSIIE